MADAKVTFETLDYEPAEPGAEARFGFNCPKHDRRCEGLLIASKSEIKRDPQSQNGGVAQWDWNGNRDAPTFHPSINCGRCWHGFIENGRTVDCGDPRTDEPEIPRTRT